MPNYLYCDLTLESEIPIAELPPADPGMSEMIFRLGNRHERSSDSSWSHHWYSSNGNVVLSHRKQGSYHWLRFPDLAEFKISGNTKEIACYSLTKIPQETIRHLLLDQVLPRCLAHQGKMMIHASAIQLEPGLLLFMGDSGSGKSTLAGNFYQAGHTVISDDCLLIKKIKDRIVAVPSYGGLRLWEDSARALFGSAQSLDNMAHYSAKWRVMLDKMDLLMFREGLPILAMIVLSPTWGAPTSEITLSRLSHREALITLMKQSFLLSTMDFKRIKRHLQTLGQIVTRLQSFRLSVPRDYDLLPTVRQKILDTVL